MEDLYEKDFYAWANEQAALLRAGNLSAADLANIAEEIESMGKREKRELVNRLGVILLHLLKWQFQPGLQSHSWRTTIHTQRRDAADHLADNPSLKSQIHAIVIRAYDKAIDDAALETGLPVKTFPSECPWTWEQIMSKDFLPNGN
jgi:hypothetical protein